MACVIAIALLATGLAVGCGGDDGGGRQVIVATFTAVPPDFTPESLQTRSAQGTAFAQTATAQPPTSATPPGTVTISGSPGTAATAQPNEVAPPALILSASGGDIAGGINFFNWWSLELEKGASIVPTTPYYPLPENEVSTGMDLPLRFTAPDSPFPVGSADIAFYRYEDSIAIPVDPSGKVIGEDSVFVPSRSEPAQQASIAGPDLAITPEVEPGKYIVSVRVNWVAPADIAQRLPEPLFTQYTFVVTVN